MSFVPDQVLLFQNKLHDVLHSVAFQSPDDIVALFTALTDDQQRHFLATEVKYLEEPNFFLESAEILKIVLVPPVSSPSVRSFAQQLLEQMRNSPYEQVRRIVVEVCAFVAL
ncbi:hypothetical protein RCL1_005094 [Eukaryota sp. TZLM3-RCL]